MEGMKQKMKNCITIQLKTNEIWIKISEEAEENEIFECLKEKIVDLKILKNKEMEEIQNIIQEQRDVAIEFESPKTLGLHGIKKWFEQEIKSSETTFYKGALRSGQKIEYEGSVVVIGDVNAGAEIIAGENIVILGDLRGLAHAGAKGNRKAIIAANIIDCPQIRIADKIKEFEKQETETAKLSYAYINEQNKMIVE